MGSDHPRGEQNARKALGSEFCTPPPHTRHWGFGSLSAFILEEILGTRYIPSDEDAKTAEMSLLALGSI